MSGPIDESRLRSLLEEVGDDVIADLNSGMTLNEIAAKMEAKAQRIESGNKSQLVWNGMVNVFRAVQSVRYVNLRLFWTIGQHMRDCETCRAIDTNTGGQLQASGMVAEMLLRWYMELTTLYAKLGHTESITAEQRIAFSTLALSMKEEKDKVDADEELQTQLRGLIDGTQHSHRDT